MEGIVNKVAESGIITLDLKDFLPDPNSIKVFDLKPFLFREMILREKEFRASMQAFDWQTFNGFHAAITCSVDAIIPMWAYMLAASSLQPVARSVFYGNEEMLTNHFITQTFSKLDPENYRDKRVVLKGCGEVPIPEAAYVAATAALMPVVKSLMYGEPCSTVPVFKKKLR